MGGVSIIGAGDSNRIAALFRKHLEEHHHIRTDSEFYSTDLELHLLGTHTMIPLSVLSQTELSSLEAIVKYLREEEGLTNSKVAMLLFRSPASIWITYRNALAKSPKRLTPSESELFIPTGIFVGKLSVLECIATYLHDDKGFSYKKIAELLKRDARTIWTVHARARRKMAS